ncbi:reverse transcriptase domain-containing protein [Tanacetum coccineum]
MAKEDEHKTAFHAPQEVYCYLKMPFGLKNAGDTYQRHNNKKRILPKGAKITRNSTRRSALSGWKKANSWGMWCQSKSLNGKLTTLNTFLSKSTEKSLPFFKTLKGCLEKKDFTWTREADKAFKEMKRYIEKYPLSVLKGAELNYLIMEKLVLALIHAARRLQRYFQAHNITVLTNKPIRLLLSKPEKSGRVARWAIELGEHEIKFRPINTGQNTSWKLYTDGASIGDGSGASLMAVNPEGKEFTYALKFEFTATNNEAGYEAVIAGLRITKEMKIEEITVFIDSQLVTNQVNGLYEAKHDHTRQYLQITKDLLKNFRYSEVQYIRRSQNRKSDALSKLASLTFDHLTKKVLVEKLMKKSIYKKQVAEATAEEGTSWMTPIMEYLVSGILPADKKLATKIRVKALNYIIIDRILYKRSFLTPWLRCVGPK